MNWTYLLLFSPSTISNGLPHRLSFLARRLRVSQTDVDYAYVTTGCQCLFPWLPSSSRSWASSVFPESGEQRGYLLFDLRCQTRPSGTAGETEAGEFAVLGDGGGVAGFGRFPLVREQAQRPLAAVFLDAGPPFLFVLEPADTDELRRAALLRPLVAGVLLLGAQAEVSPGVVQAVVVDKQSLWENRGFLCCGCGKSWLILIS